MSDENERSVASTGSVATGWSEELVSVVADYRIEWRQPEGRQDALELLMRSTGGGGGMGGGHHGPYSATAVGKPRLSQPTLTDAEREALARLSFLLSQHGWAEDGVVLRGLLERLG